MIYDNLRFDVLFGQITDTLNNYKELDRISGESFNVFKLLKMETNEVKMHSAFIGDLLNPSGTHGQGKVFLDLFIEEISQKKDTLDTSNCITTIEHHMGAMNEERTEGGRIDIMIRDRNDRHIIIENKIHAPDQDNQLVRYFNKAEHVQLFYLTLNGGLPSENSCGHLVAEEHFFCISYAYHIIKWLESCRKQAAILPMLRESISQYINLIKYLTNQTTSHNMQTKVTAIIKENLEASFLIKANLGATLDILSREFGDQVEAAFAGSEFDCTYEIDFYRNYSGIWFYHRDWKYVKIGFQFQTTNHNLLYGFTKHHNELNEVIPIPPGLALALSSIGNNIKKESNWWAWRQYIDQPYADWTKIEAWQAIEDGTMLDMIQHHVKKLNEIVADERIAAMMRGENVLV
jgi:hypothetical protein